MNKKSREIVIVYIQELIELIEKKKRIFLLLIYIAKF